MRKCHLYVFLVIFMVITICTSGWTATASGFCKDFTLADIPVGNFHQPLTTPMSTLRITQGYNTSKTEGYCQEGGQASADSAACKGKKIYYGHDGLDLHPKGVVAGQSDIYAVQPGLVIASHKSGSFSGWGETLILATRANLYSEEILTFHYHHLYASFSPTYETSRLYQACSQVVRGAVIAKEGGTPNWPTHLHFTIKRWKNLQELQDQINKTPGQFYGYGYIYSNQNKLLKFLNPESWLFDYFEEFHSLAGSYPNWQWAQSYALNMRYLGWFFGEFDGHFGVDYPVKRREAARWLKLALKLKSSKGKTPYTDLSNTDDDSVYVRALLDYGQAVKIFDPSSVCQGKAYQFCPEQSLTRAEAIKIVVAGLFQEEFLEVYNNWVWKNTGAIASQILSHFQDVPPTNWVAPYLYFAWQKGLTGENLKFNPDQPITRAEFAKWLVLSYQIKAKLKPNACHSVSCGEGFFCDQSNQGCQEIPTCIPDLNQTCPLGGGNQSGNSSGVLPPPSNTSSPSNPISGCACSSGPCCDGCQIRPSNAVCQSYIEYRCSGSSSNQFSEKRYAHKFCSGIQTSCDGAFLLDPWKTFQQCSFGQNCQESGSQVSCSSSIACTDSFVNTSSSSCFGNPTKSGQPVLCLETKQYSGVSWDWRVCKAGNTFINNFDYELLDLNHLNKYLGKYKGIAGSDCSPWQNVSFSYLNSVGPTYGASLQVQVSSPQGCLDSNCTYFTGQTTVYKQCNLKKTAA